MSCTKWYYNNLVTDASMSASSENALFPLSNISDIRRTKVFRSLTNADHIYFDFGSAEPIDSIVLVDHIFNGFGISTASLELNNVPTWTSGAPVTIAVTIDATNGIGFGKHISTVNYRYAKLLLTSSLSYCELSKIFIGKEAIISDAIDFDYPLKFKRDDKAIISKNRYNQAFVDEVFKVKTITGNLNTMNRDEVDVCLEMDKICSITRPLFVRFEQSVNSLLNDNDELSGYYMFKNEIDLSLVRGGYWNGTISLEEAG